MNKAYGTDPVSAIAESEATGEAAEIFADIRATMEIPMLTSIWRTLVAVDGGLRAGWRTVKPLHQTGIPAAALARVIAGAGLPLPQPRIDVALPSAELAAAQAIVDAYNRSNGMNMIALTALVVMPDAAALDDTRAPSPAPWPVLRPLLAADDIDADTWALLQDINRFGGGTGALATLWRHLAHWPGLLAAIQAGFAPLQQSGALREAMQRVHNLGRDEAAGLATLYQGWLIMTHLTDRFSSLGRSGARRRATPRQAARDASSGEKRPAFGGPRRLSGCVVPLARWTPIARRVAPTRKTTSGHQMGHY